MEKYPKYFNKEDPELMTELKEFVADVKRYMFNGKKPKKEFTRNNIRNITIKGSIPVRMIKLGRVAWGFAGHFYNDEPVARYAYIYFKGKVICEAKRTGGIKPVALNLQDEVYACVREASGLIDPDNPWSKPKSLHPNKYDIHYTSEYKGENDEFTLKESVDTSFGFSLYESLCKIKFLS